MIFKLYIYCVLLILIINPISGFSQQQPFYSQYMFNGMALNPAYAGSHESLSLTAVSRHQWVNMEGAPSTQTFTAHTPLKNEKVGLGMMILRDNIGITNQLAAHFAYAYKIKFRKGTLSSGLQFDLSQYKSNYSNLNITNDVAFGADDISKVYPNFGAGLFYSTRSFYAGFSVPRLMAGKFENSDPVYNINHSRHYFFTSGYVFTLNQDFKLKPNVLVQIVNGSPVTMDINSNLLIKEVVWVGVSVKSFHSLSSLIELQISDQFRFGYAYDFPFSSEIKGWNFSSHEFMLNYNFTFYKYKSHSPRYF
ncbi:MAG: type IX secretion system membrane protein PorP/SprF [Bacteroidota bacterium]|nr:type IX secretion system membrane protein PorP/SprF [Bacteroidota bacterium]